MQDENTLSKIFDTNKIQSLISNLKNGPTDILIWKLLGDQKYLAPIKLETIRKVRGDFVISAIPGSESKFHEIVAGTGNIDFYIPSSGTLFRAKLKHFEEDRFYIELPTFIVQSERRQIQRTQVFEAEDFNISFLKKVKTYKEISQHFEKRCFDISTGGYSFFISKSETQFFRVEDLIPMSKLKINDFDIILDSKVVRITEVEPSDTNGLRYKALLVSCAFQNLNDINRKKIEKLLFERFQADLHVINS